jgi:hypothetical protein
VTGLWDYASRGRRRSLRVRLRTHSRIWNRMSEADRVFPRHRREEPITSGDKRLILSAPRRSGLGASKTSKSRVVEVVYVRRERSRPTEDRPRPAPWSVRAETWPEGFRAKSAVPLRQHDLQPAAPDAAQPTVHVMPMWEPSPQQPAPPTAEPVEPAVKAQPVDRRKASRSQEHRRWPRGSSLTHSPRMTAARIASAAATSSSSLGRSAA